MKLLAFAVLVAFTSTAAAGPTEAPWQRECRLFITKLADALDRAPKDCAKLAGELDKLAPDARKLRALLIKEGKHLHDFVADKDLQARIFSHDPNPLAYCSGNKRFDAALERGYLFAENGKL